MNNIVRTTTYQDGQSCPKCKDGDSRCINCGRIKASGVVTLSEIVDGLANTLLSLLERK